MPDARGRGAKHHHGRPEARQPDASVVIAACNEASVIGGTLAALLDDARDGEFEVVVVCNGCTDGTARIAADFAPMVRVLETSLASKSRALNLGDTAASVFPRFYVDADVRLHTRDVRCIAASLASTSGLAASPRLEMDLSASSWPVRSYQRIWMKLPSVRDGLVGRGVYCLSEEGRARFGPFPEVIADDLFMHVVFAPGARVSVARATSVVEAPHSLRGLLERKTRAFAGNRQLQALSGGNAGASSDPLAWLGAVAGNPRLAWDVPTYLFVTLVAKLRGRWKALRGDVARWNRDESTRVGREGGRASETHVSA